MPIHRTASISTHRNLIIAVAETVMIPLIRGRVTIGGFEKLMTLITRAIGNGRQENMIRATQQLPAVNSKDGESRDYMTTDHTLTTNRRIGEEQSPMMTGGATASIVLEETAVGKATMVGIRENVTATRTDVRQTIKKNPPKHRRTVHGNLVQGGNPVEVVRDIGTNALVATTPRVRTRGRRSISTVSDHEEIENVTEVDIWTVNVDHPKIL